MTMKASFCPFINAQCVHGTTTPSGSRIWNCKPCPIKALQDLADSSIKREEGTKEFRKDLKAAMGSAFAQIVNNMVGAQVAPSPPAEEQKPKTDNWWPENIACPKCSQAVEIEEEPETYLVTCTNPECKYEIPVSPNLK